MCGILIAETIIEPKTRLTAVWRFGARKLYCQFPTAILCFNIAVCKSKAGMFSGIIGLISIGVSTLTGERTNFLIRACGGVLAGIVWKPKFILISLLVLLKF